MSKITKVTSSLLIGGVLLLVGCEKEMKLNKEQIKQLEENDIIQEYEDSQKPQLKICGEQDTEKLEANYFDDPTPSEESDTYIKCEY